MPQKDISIGVGIGGNIGADGISAVSPAVTVNGHGGTLAQAKDGASQVVSQASSQGGGASAAGTDVPPASSLSQSDIAEVAAQEAQRFWEATHGEDKTPDQGDDGVVPVDSSGEVGPDPSDDPSGVDPDGGGMLATPNPRDDQYASNDGPMRSVSTGLVDPDPIETMDGGGAGIADSGHLNPTGPTAAFDD